MCVCSYDKNLVLVIVSHHTKFSANATTDDHTMTIRMNGRDGWLNQVP